MSSMDIDARDVLMVTRARAAELANIREGRLAYWERTELVVPTADKEVSNSRRHRLYGYTDLLSLLIIAELRESVTLQHIRSVIDYLHRNEWLVSEVRFAVIGKRIYFQLPDGEWSDGGAPRQIVLWQVLNLQPLRARILETTRRREGTEGRSERRRGTRGSRPVIAGTRVPLATVVSFLEEDAADSEILEAFPELSRRDIDFARGTVSA